MTPPPPRPPKKDTLRVLWKHSDCLFSHCYAHFYILHFNIRDDLSNQILAEDCKTFQILYLNKRRGIVRLSDVSGMLHKYATECYITAHWAVNSYTNIKNRAELRLFVKGGGMLYKLCRWGKYNLKQHILCCIHRKKSCEKMKFQFNQN